MLVTFLWPVPTPGRAPAFVGRRLSFLGPSPINRPLWPTIVEFAASVGLAPLFFLARGPNFCGLCPHQGASLLLIFHRWSSTNWYIFPV